MEGRAGVEARPHPAALPTRVRVVDPAVKPATVKAERIGHPHLDPLTRLRNQRKQRVRGRAGGNGDVLTQTERVELVDPVVIVVIRVGGHLHALQPRTRRLIERPPFGAMLPGRRRPVPVW